MNWFGAIWRLALGALMFAFGVQDAIEGHVAWAVMYFVLGTLNLIFGVEAATNDG